MTHKELVVRADKVLRSWKLSPVYCEKASCALSEFPDAIGWNSRGESHLVEVKTSISDLKADAKKPHRLNPETGMGDYRWYLVPELMPCDKIDLPTGWGLLVHHEKSDRVRRALKAEKMQKNAYAELSLLRARINEIAREAQEGGRSDGCEIQRWE